MLKPQYDVAIIGGGLAGLALSIQLADAGVDVLLLEKEKYPYHKVCGEYISNESWRFLESLSVPLAQMHLPKINTLQLSAPNGTLFHTTLPLGGFGISRYTLDHLMATLAKDKGVTLLEEAKVTAVESGHNFTIDFTHEGGTYTTAAAVACGAFGKRSNLDVKWQRPFVAAVPSKMDNYVGVKYHVQTHWPEHLIGLHNFKDGYCGISKIEDDKYCLCYLTTAQNLKDNNNKVAQLEQSVLSHNPVLQKIFKEATFLKAFPVTIAQISFSKKAQVESGVLMLGDAAGMITPLCGNGMSMALHSSKIAAGLIVQYLQKDISFDQLTQQYQQQWQKQFSSRLAAGRLLQRFFGRESLSNFFVHTFKTMPFLAQAIIKKTHGQPF